MVQRRHTAATLPPGNGGFNEAAPVMVQRRGDPGAGKSFVMLASMRLHR